MSLHVDMTSSALRRSGARGKRFLDIPDLAIMLVSSSHGAGYCYREPSTLDLSGKSEQVCPPRFACSGFVDIGTGRKTTHRPAKILSERFKEGRLPARDFPMPIFIKERVKAIRASIAVL